VTPFAPQAGTADRTSPRQAQAAYLFALVRGVEARAPLWSEKDPFPRLFIHRAGTVGAIVSMVALDDFAGPVASQLLGDLTWLGPRAVYHAGVLRQAMHWSPVYPVPFATLYASLDSLTDLMLAHQQTIGRFFETVAGMEEWELKASAAIEGHAALEAVARDAWPDWAALSPGVRYMKLCSDRSTLIAASRRHAEQIVSRLVWRMRPPVAAIRRLTRQHPADQAATEMVARFALLTPAGSGAALDGRARVLGAEAVACGVTLTLSGPWPAFSFRPDLPNCGDGHQAHPGRSAGAACSPIRLRRHRMRSLPKRLKLFREATETA
jgi:hypothetical protein